MGSNRGDITVSAVIKARNEGHQIADCIASIADLADEIIIVDDASDDDTADAARAAGAVVVPARSEQGYINVLDRIGFEVATGDWLVRLDADERMTPSLAAELRALATRGDVDGVRFARRNMMFGDWPRHGGWFVADQLRFFRAASWQRDADDWERDLHAHPTVVGNIIDLPADPSLATVHLDYDDVPQFVRRSLDRYARTEAQLRFSRGARFSLLRAICAPVRRFVGRFVLRQGFRDGARGFALAALLAAYDLMIELNLWDLGRDDGVARAERG